MRRLVVSVGVAAVLALTGCSRGGDDGESAVATTTTTTVPFCDLARTYIERFEALLPAIGDPVRLRAATVDVEAAIRQAQASAPPEVSSDVNVVATTAREVLAGLEENDFDIGRTPEIVKLQDPRFQTSVTNLNRYARENCGVSPGS